MQTPCKMDQIKRLSDPHVVVKGPPVPEQLTGKSRFALLTKFS